MIKYRQLTGGLLENLEATVEINNLVELIKHINKTYDNNVCEINFQHIGIDEKIHWYTYYVLVRFQNIAGFKLVGISEGKF